MGSPPPSPPVITLFEPVWDYVLYFYQTTGILFQLTANQASQFFIYHNGILIGQSPLNITTWSYTFTTTPAPSETPYIVRAVVQNSNGSSEHIWHMVITPTEVTSKPVLQKINPTTVDLPTIPLNTTQPLSLIVSVDQWSTLTLKIDGVMYGTPQYISEPNSPVTFAIGLDYLNNPLNIGEHTIAINAENSNGISDTALVYILNLVCPSEYVPSGDFIPWPVKYWRPDSNSPWTAPPPPDEMECTWNAAMNFAYTGNPSQSDRNRLSSFQWRKNDNCPDTCAQPYIPIGGPKGCQVYHVRRLGPQSCNLQATGHAMLALYCGPTPPTDTDYKSWSNWQFFQYGETNISVGGANCTDQIPRPITANDTVRVTISHIAGFGSDLSTGPTLSAGNKIVTFDIPSTGNPTALPNPE